MSFYAIISGTGSGTGASVARLFAKKYAVVLLSRSESSYKPIVDDINASGGKAIGISADASDPAAIDAAFSTISEKLPGAKLAAAVFNANAGFKLAPFLDLTTEDFNTSLGTAAHGLFLFAKKTLPQLEAAAESSLHPPTLIVTGATAAIRGSAKFASFAAGKFAQRGITQSLAREYGPKGVHVAYTIIDGGIDTPWGKALQMNGGVKDGKISPDAIAESYWYLHTQPKSAFTQELDLRPFIEKF